MPRQVQRYVTELLVEILGPVEVEKRFDWCRGEDWETGRIHVTLDNGHIDEGVTEEMLLSPKASELTSGYRHTRATSTERD